MTTTNRATLIASLPSRSCFLYYLKDIIFFYMLEGLID